MRDAANLGFQKPPMNLERFVRRVIISDYEIFGELALNPWSTGNMYMILFFGPLDNYFVSVNGRPRRFVSPVWFAGQLEYHQVRVAIRQRSSAVVVEFLPQAFWQLFGRPGRWLTGRTCDPADIGPSVKAAADRHFGALTSNPDQCFDRVSAFLAERAAVAGQEDGMLAEALTIMHDQNGRIAVADVARRLGLTPRHLTRRFHEIIGLAPKFYGRVLQINQVIEMMFMPDAGSIAGVASEGGYYDQAHLNRAMKLFFSEGPSRFLKSDHLLFRTFLEQA